MQSVCNIHDKNSMTAEQLHFHRMLLMCFLATMVLLQKKSSLQLIQEYSTLINDVFIGIMDLNHVSYNDRFSCIVVVVLFFVANFGK